MVSKEQRRIEKLERQLVDTRLLVKESKRSERMLLKERDWLIDFVFDLKANLKKLENKFN